MKSDEKSNNSRSNISDNLSPYISIVIFSHHSRKEYLKEAIESAINQTLPRSLYEIIVVKDYQDPPLEKFLLGNGVINIMSNDSFYDYLYNAVNASRAEIISFLDDDDLFLPEKMAKVHEIFKDNKINVYRNLNFFFSRDIKLDEYNQRHLEEFKSIFGSHLGLVNIEMFKKNPSLVEHLSNNSSISIRKKTLYAYIEIMKTNKAGIGFDNILILIGLETGLAIDSNILTKERIHRNNLYGFTLGGHEFATRYYWQLRAYSQSVSLILNDTTVVNARVIVKFTYLTALVRLRVFNIQNNKDDLKWKDYFIFVFSMIFAYKKFKFYYVVSLIEPVQLRIAMSKFYFNHLFKPVIAP